MRQGTKTEGKGHGVAHLRTLLPFVGKHWLALAVGFLFMLVQNYGAVRVPGYFQTRSPVPIGRARSRA
jgi:hypothetical protein